MGHARMALEGAEGANGIAVWSAIYVTSGQSPRIMLPPYLFGLASKTRMLLRRGAAWVSLRLRPRRDKGGVCGSSDVTGIARLCRPCHMSMDWRFLAPTLEAVEIVADRWARS